MTIRQVANAAGVTEATVSRWETGEIKNMRSDKVSAVSTVLRMSPDELFGRQPVGTAIDQYMPLINRLDSLPEDEREKMLAMLLDVVDFLERHK